MMIDVLENLLNDPDINEVLINNFQTIYYEKQGYLQKTETSFLTSANYHLYIHHLLKESHQNLDAENPTLGFQLNGCRYQIIHPTLTKADFSISIRKYNFKKFDLTYFLKNTKPQELVSTILNKKNNFLVLGNTGSGKTTFVNGCLNALNSQERVVILEDTPELKSENSCCLNLYTRITDGGTLQSIDLSRLIKESLRLRPDRIVVGEVRGPEAKDLLLALSTGHRGSFGTLHAANAQEALMRLEMLVQLGAPQWSLETVRRMIFFGLNYLITVAKDSNGHRFVSQISKITSLESSGFLLEDLLA